MVSEFLIRPALTVKSTGERGGDKNKLLSYFCNQSSASVRRLYEHRASARRLNRCAEKLGRLQESVIIAGQYKKKAESKVYL